MLVKIKMKLTELNELLLCKKSLVFLVIVSILLVGCSVPNQNGMAKDTIVGNEGEVLDSIESDNDEQPPAPPDDNEPLQSISDKQSSKKDDDDEPPALPSDENKETSINALKESSINPGEFVGLWRAFSSRLFYDAGGGGAVGSGTGQPLEINAEGSWQLSTSAGTWKIENIKEEDWKTWNIDSYGPKRKIVLDNWNSAIASGPVEESDGRVDFFWVIYRAEPPIVSAPGQVQAKYGHAS